MFLIKTFKGQEKSEKIMNAYIFGDVEAKTSFVSGKKDNISLELRNREWRA